MTEKTELLDTISFFADESIVPYLFFSLSSICEFIVIEEEMQQLNDLCYTIENSVVAKLKELNRDKERLEKKEVKVEDPDYGDMTNECLASLVSFDIPKWEDTYFFLTKANIILLQVCFLERSLTWLCERLSENPVNKKKLTSPNGKIFAYLEFLESLGYSIPKPEGFEDQLKNVRRIRNKYAHGDWDEVRKEIREFSLKGFFHVITELFEAIESAVYPEK